ncbi:GNAT family N-acetyltransferase [Hymenobacter tenuis]
MPLHLLRHHELDLDAWDACVAEAQQKVPYAHSWWLAATAGRWDAVVEQDAATGRYLSVLPLPVKRRLWGREVVQPHFTQQLGLFTTPLSQHKDLSEYLALLPGHFTRLFLQLNSANTLVAPPAGFAAAQRVTYQLSLGPEYAALWAGYTPDYRRRLRLNQRQAQPLQVAETQQADDLISLFRQQTGKAAGLRSRHYQQLRRLVAALQQRSAISIFEVRHPSTQELLAGAVFVLHAGGVIYLFAGASVTGKKMHAPLLLLDHLIWRYAGTPGSILDFEGGMIPSIARFFANFGAAPVPYVALSFTKRPWYLKWMR